MTWRDLEEAAKRISWDVLCERDYLLGRVAELEERGLRLEGLVIALRRALVEDIEHRERRKSD